MPISIPIPIPECIQVSMLSFLIFMSMLQFALTRFRHLPFIGIGFVSASSLWFLRSRVDTDIKLIFISHISVLIMVVHFATTSIYYSKKGMAIVVEMVMVLEMEIRMAVEMAVVVMMAVVVEENDSSC